MHDGYLSAGTRIKLLALDLNHATCTIVQDTVWKIFWQILVLSVVLTLHFLIFLVEFC